MAGLDLSGGGLATRLEDTRADEGKFGASQRRVTPSHVDWDPIGAPTSPFGIESPEILAYVFAITRPFITRLTTLLSCRLRFGLAQPLSSMPLSPQRIFTAPRQKQRVEGSLTAPVAKPLFPNCGHGALPSRLIITAKCEQISIMRRTTRPFDPQQKIIQTNF